MAESDWTYRTKQLLKAELKRADVTYEELARRLTAMGMPETKASVTNKIARGGFPAAFMMASLRAIGCETVRVGDL